MTFPTDTDAVPEWISRDSYYRLVPAPRDIMLFPLTIKPLFGILVLCVIIGISAGT